MDDEGNEVGQLEAATLEECESAWPSLTFLTAVLSLCVSVLSCNRANKCPEGSCNADDACKSITFCQKWGTCFLKVGKGLRGRRFLCCQEVRLGPGSVKFPRSACVPARCQVHCMGVVAR